MAGGGVGMADEQPEAVGEPIADLLRGEHPRPGGGQLDGQGYPVEPMADLGHRRGQRLVRHLEVGAGLAGALDEQPDGLIAVQRVEADRRWLGGRREVRHPPGHLALDG